MIELLELKQRLHQEQQARQQAEQQLSKSNEHLSNSARQLSEFALFSELSPQPVLRFDHHGKLLLANPTAIASLGMHIETETELQGLFPETDLLPIDEIIRNDSVVPVKVNIEGTYYKAMIRGVSEFGFINVYLTDITQLEEFRQKIEEERVETEQLIEAISSILIGLDADGIINRWNTAAEAVFGIPAHEALHQHIDVHSVNWSLGTLSLISALLEGERSVVVEDAMFRNAAGQEGHIHVTITKIVNTEQQKIGYLILARDITRKKVIEQQLLQSQKLESLGNLAAGIAHEINTPIQYIGDNTHFLSTAFQRLDAVLNMSEQLIKRYESGVPIEANLEEMAQQIQATKLSYIRSEVPYAIEESIKGLEQVASIVRGMKQFSHPGTGSKKLTNLNECLENTITVSRNEWKYVSELTTHLDPNLPQVMCHTTELNQVFLNLIINAAQAIEEAKNKDKTKEGIITIRTTTKDKSAVVEITDTGTGIPKNIVQKVFDPFFTTKEPGKGTGQGLAIAHSVILNHNGSITVDTEEGQGTTFRIQLPAYTQDNEGR